MLYHPTMPRWRDLKRSMQSKPLPNSFTFLTMESKHQETRFEVAPEVGYGGAESLHATTTHDTEKAASFTNSETGLAFKTETAKAERKLIRKLGKSRA